MGDPNLRNHVLEYEMDKSKLPASFVQQVSQFETSIKNILKAFAIPDDEEGRARAAFIKGDILLRGITQTREELLRLPVQEAWWKGQQTTKSTDKTKDIYNYETYHQVAHEIHKMKPEQKIFYQELAYVAQYVIDNAQNVPVDHASFPTQVKIALQDYVESGGSAISLELPPLTGDAGQDLEIEDKNILAVGIIYLAHQMERMRLFDVVDRVTERFMNGLLPIGDDPGGCALDRYYWTSEERLTVAARHMVYTRVLGVQGGETSKEAPPNREFDTLFMRFISSLAEYAKQSRISDLFSTQNRSLGLTAEQIRKAGRDLAANCSLYGWGGTQFAANKLRKHVKVALDILKQPTILRVYGISSPYQVIERVAASEFGQAPNIVKLRTSAESGNKLLELVARYKTVWSQIGGQPLFADQYSTANTVSDITPEDQQAMITHAQSWLTVNGLGDEQVNKYSQPADTLYSPSTPAPTDGSSASNDAVERLRQMVSSGTAPSLDQLQQLLPSFR